MLLSSTHNLGDYFVSRRAVVLATIIVYFSQSTSFTNTKFRHMNIRCAAFDQNTRRPKHHCEKKEYGDNITDVYTNMQYFVIKILHVISRSNSNSLTVPLQTKNSLEYHFNLFSRPTARECSSI